MKKTPLPIIIVLSYLLPFIPLQLTASVFPFTPLTALAVKELGVILGALAAFGVYKKYNKLPQMSAKKADPLLMLSLTAFSASIAEITMYLSLADGNYTEYEEQLSLVTVLSFISVVFLNPTAEEFVFRYMVIEIMPEKQSTFRKIAVSSLLFCMVHLMGMTSVLNIADILISSAVYAAVYLKTRKLFYTCIAHSVHNLAVELLLNTSVEFIRSDMLIIISAVIFICSAAVITKLILKADTENSAEQITGKDK